MAQGEDWGGEFRKKTGGGEFRKEGFFGTRLPSRLSVPHFMPCSKCSALECKYLNSLKGHIYIHIIQILNTYMIIHLAIIYCGIYTCIHRIRIYVSIWYFHGIWMDFCILLYAAEILMVCADHI